MACAIAGPRKRVGRSGKERQASERRLRVAGQECTHVLLNRALTISVRQDRMPFQYVTVECELVDVEQPPAPERVLAVLRRYLSWDDAQGLVAAELGSPTNAVVLYTARPTRWFAAAFGDDAG